MEGKTKPGGGGRLARSEVVTIRLDPKLNYLADLAARTQRRTKSSLIEAALAEALNVVRVDPRPSANDERTIAQIGEALWHVDEPERLRRLAMFAPHLMTYEEQKIWAVITKNPYFWIGEWRAFDLATEIYYYTNTDPATLWIPGVEAHWDTIKRVSAGELSSDQLPQVEVTRPSQTTSSALTLPARSAAG